MDIYTERAILTQFISKIYSSSIEHDDAAQSEEWSNVLIVDTPAGQLSWHIATSDLHLFAHLPYKNGIRKWDGHTTSEKYERLQRLH